LQASLAASPGARLRQRRMRGKHRRHEPRTCLLEVCVRGRTGEGAVLDRIHAGLQRGGNAVFAVRVCGNFSSERLEVSAHQ
jgi:hypothetical protein